jgi:translation initiation factor IF-3
VSDLGFIESNPRQDGRNMIMVLGPHKKKSEARADVEAEKQRRVADRQAEEEADRAERAEQVQRREKEKALGGRKPKGPADNLDPD